MPFFLYLISPLPLVPLYPDIITHKKTCKESGKMSYTGFGVFSSIHSITSLIQELLMFQKSITTMGRNNLSYSNISLICSLTNCYLRALFLVFVRKTYDKKCNEFQISLSPFFFLFWKDKAIFSLFVSFCT